MDNDTLTPEEMALCGIPADATVTLVEVCKPPSMYGTRRALRAIGAVAHLAMANEALMVNAIAMSDEHTAKAVALVGWRVEDSDPSPLLPALAKHVG